VAIARALVNNPPMILADEPYASLSPKTAQVVLSKFLAICREERKTLLVVSHEEQVLFRIRQARAEEAVGATIMKV
jgi:putative ABC transport system ATP-binding protein